MSTYFMCHFIRKSSWLLLVVILFYSDIISAKVKFYTVVEKTRGASLIFIADVVEVKSDHLILHTTIPLKGSVPKTPINLFWGGQNHSELPENIVNAKDTILVFANPNGNGVYQPFSGVQGALKLEPGWSSVYEDAITKIIRFDSASSPESKSSILKTMLSGSNQISENSALEIAYLEYYTGKFRVADLIQPVMLLTQSPDKSISLFAIQLLGKIGDKTTVPLLINMLGSQDEDIASKAYQVLNLMLDMKLPIDIKQSYASRKTSSMHLLKWWNENKETIVLTR